MGPKLIYRIVENAANTPARLAAWDNKIMMKIEIHDRLSIDNRGVSPVIGVILMVAITVILAAVIGTFVLDLGQSAGNQAPSASLTVTASPSPTETINVSHKGGDALISGNTRVIISNSSASVTYDASGENAFTVGQEIGFATNQTGDATTTWALDEPTGSTVQFDSGDQIDIQIIDTESQRVIFETTVTA